MDKKKLFEAAIVEFGIHGFENAKIESIAKIAKIPVDEIRNEYKSKESLFKSVVEYGFQYLQKVFDEIISSEAPTLVKFEKLLRIAIDYSLKYPELVRLYHEITAEESNNLTPDLSKKLESISINAYKKLIKISKEKGEIPKNTDEAFLAYAIDNLFLITQFSYIPGYYQERMKVYIGEKYLKDIDSYVEKMMDIISRNFIPEDYNGPYV